MEPFEVIKSTAVPLPAENIDTDQIIPARFLKMVSRVGFGENLFRDWRYDREGHLNPDFVLNNPVYGGSILIAGRNFGCGSSREHAAWALYQYGFRVVVSSEFADIFKNNALNNGIVTVELSADELHQAFLAVEADPRVGFRVDLEHNRFSIVGTDVAFNFKIDPFKRLCLMKGMDELDYLLSLDEQISVFERSQKTY